MSLVENEQVEALVRAMVDHFAAWGGVPLVSVFDRPKTIALKWTKDGVVTEWNATFAGVALDLGVGVELCWPYSPEQKGAVENLVGWVKGSFFKRRRFVDEADLHQQLTEWHDDVNTKRPSRATRVIPVVPRSMLPTTLATRASRGARNPTAGSITAIASTLERRRNVRRLPGCQTPQVRSIGATDDPWRGVCTA